MKPAAIGVRMHSGWGALIAISIRGGAVEMVERRRPVIVPSGIRGGKQPYHFAKSLEPTEAERFFGEYFEASKHLASGAIRDLIGEFDGRYRVAGAAILLASGRTLPPLPNILASHALIHAAEGEFFRQVFSKACENLDLPVTGFRERDLDECLAAAFGKAANKTRQQVSALGRRLGPPWTQDQKMASLAALLVLATRDNT